MKQKIGVCIFSAIIVLGAAVTIRIVGEKNIPPEELEIDTEENTQNSEEIPVQVAVDTQEETVTTNKELEYHAYNLQIKNDKLVVCTSKNEVFFETGIWMEELPDYIIADISSGLYFDSEDELYSFLESYSS